MVEGDEKKPLPCPFCGCKAEMTGPCVGEWWVKCTMCDASTKMMGDVRGALAAWNRRYYVEAELARRDEREIPDSITGVDRKWPMPKLARARKEGQ